MINTKSWILAVFIAIGLTNSGCDTISANQFTPDNQIISQVENPQLENSKIFHVINRLSFGAAPGDIEKVREIGIEKYIQQQLTPESIPEPQSLKNKLAQLQTLRLTPSQLYSRYSISRLPKPTALF